MEDSLETFARENLGVAGTNTNSLVEQHILDQFFQLEHFAPAVEWNARYVVIGVDPNSSMSATSSEMAIISFCDHFGTSMGMFFIVFFLSCSSFIVDVRHADCFDIVGATGPRKRVDVHAPVFPSSH